MADADVKAIFDRIPEAFNADAAQGVDAVFQFEITGDGGGTWNVVIKDGACEVREGAHDDPSVTMAMSTETWMGIVNKELNGIQAFMSGKLKVSGDMMLAQKYQSLFSF
jgi:putative sterol carrier protein